jgi:hypothetical protein
MAAPLVRATVEVEMVNADDFCELVAQALGGDVLHMPLVVTSGRLWHYAGVSVSCRLGYLHTRARLTVRSSAAACRWFRRVAQDWRPSRARQVAVAGRERLAA